MLPVSQNFHNSISSFPRTITASATLSGTEISDSFEIVVTEELDPIGNNAPPKEAHITLSNVGFNPYTSELQTKQVITIAFNLLLPDGTFEVVPMGTFYLYNWHSDSNYLTHNPLCPRPARCHEWHQLHRYVGGWRHQFK